MVSTTIRCKCCKAISLAMRERWKGVVDDKKVFRTFLTHLSKAFDCLSHELIIAKLNAYDFSLPALKLIHNYLSNRQQRTKINHDFSSWEEASFGLTQGSVLGSKGSVLGST